MSIDVGDRLDKYELMERVGQGGMAVVYRGMDTSLRREVAVKVLHRHLAESKEARDRFEREAQAVAKLRHENILEIFDFSGGESEQSYIVTEFIDGQTLKQFITDREITFPEIGAMIALQVCRALEHAHKFGVLHRDIKPENIMIRRDGVIKLTDFGIAQMLDLQRMTVTGQLLGSPAYMAPEHLEGKGLDFRTDVFAVGIVLYQLITGELPFKGKNPHEILKRIAECRYIDPQVVKPRCARELARIVALSLAREKEDRYPDVAAMTAALEAFLRGCGLTNDREELEQFFEDAAAYEAALRPRLLGTLAARGRAEMEAGNQAAALELFNRVLTIDPEHAEVLAILDRVGRRRRAAKIALLCAAVAGAAAAVFGIRAMIDGDDEPGRRIAAADVPDAASTDPEALARRRARAGPWPDAGAVPAALDAAVARGPADAAPRETAVGDRPTPNRRRDAGAVRPPARTDAGPEAPTGGPRKLALEVSPLNSEYRIDDGPWRPISSETSITLPPGNVTIAARNTLCCAEVSRSIPAAQTGGRIEIALPFLPATITPRCAKADVSVKIDGQPARLDKLQTIALDDTLGSRRVKVLFFGGAEEVLDEQTVEVRYKDDKVVTCVP